MNPNDSSNWGSKLYKWSQTKKADGFCMGFGAVEHDWDLLEDFIAKEIERAYMAGYGRGYQTAIYNQKLLAKKTI